MNLQGMEEKFGMYFFFCEPYSTTLVFRSAVSAWMDYFFVVWIIFIFLLDGSHRSILFLINISLLFSLRTRIRTLWISFRYIY